MPHGRPLRLAVALLMAGSLALAAACTPASSTRPGVALMSDTRAHGHFVSRQLERDGTVHRYQVFLPSRRAGGERPALIMFLHGSGERGDDNRKQVEVGLGPVVRSRLDEFPAIVVFPQMHTDHADLERFGDTAFAILDAVQAEFDGDPQRVLLTGLSLGGYASFELALMQPERFAAVVPICGGFDPPEAQFVARRKALGGVSSHDEAAQKLRGIPFWVFHGAKDDVVSVENSRQMVAALKRAGAEVRYTEFPEAKHNSWDPAYATAALWPWLFAQRRP